MITANIAVFPILSLTVFTGNTSSHPSGVLPVPRTTCRIPFGVNFPPLTAWRRLSRMWNLAILAIVSYMTSVLFVSAAGSTADAASDATATTTVSATTARRSIARATVAASVSSPVRPNRWRGRTNITRSLGSFRYSRLSLDVGQVGYLRIDPLINRQIRLLLIHIAYGLPCRFFYDMRFLY